MPASPAGSLRQQVMQQYAYLFQMAQQLNLALEQLEQAESGTVRAAGAASGGAAARRLLKKYKRLGEVYEGNRDNLFLVSLVLRVTNLSNDILGLFFGALGMNYWQYLASSFVGILPTMVLYTVLGNDLDLTSTPVLICLGVDVACIAAAWLVLRLRKKRKGKPNEEKAL